MNKSFEVASEFSNLRTESFQTDGDFNFKNELNGKDFDGRLIFTSIYGMKYKTFPIKPIVTTAEYFALKLQNIDAIINNKAVLETIQTNINSVAI